MIRVCQLREGDRFRLTLAGPVFKVVFITDNRLFYSAKNKVTESIGKNSNQYINIEPPKIKPPQNLKLCTKCGELKPLDCFSKNNHLKNKKEPRCRDCRKAANKIVDFPEVFINHKVWNGKKP